MRHGIAAAAGIVAAVTVGSWIGRPGPASQEAAPAETPADAPAVVLDLAGRRAPSPTTTVTVSAPRDAEVPAHLDTAPPTSAPDPVLIATTTTAAPPLPAAARPVEETTAPAPPDPGTDLADTSADPAPTPTGDAPAFLASLNSLRGAHGVAALSRNGELDALAQSWAARMAADDHLRHSELIYDVVAGAWTTAGENIGYGPTVEVIFGALEASPGHLDNMLNPDFTSVGIGVVRVGDVLWTAHLFAG